MKRKLIITAYLLFCFVGTAYIQSNNNKIFPVAPSASSGPATELEPGVTIFTTGTDCVAYSDASGILQCDSSKLLYADSGLGDAVFEFRRTMSGASSTSNFLNITGTLPVVTAGAAQGILAEITGSGSTASGDRYGMRVRLLPGYTGGSNSVAIFGSHTGAAAGTLISNNVAVFGSADCTGNVCIGGGGKAASNPTVGGIGMLGRIGGDGGGAGDKWAGVYGAAQGTATPTVAYGGFFKIDELTGASADVDTTGFFNFLTGKAALGASNSTTTANIFELYDNTTLVFQYADGGAAAVVSGTFAFNNDIILNLGTTVGDTRPGISFNTVQTVDTGMLLTGTVSNHWVIAERQDDAFDFAHAATTDPTLFVHSAAQSTTQWTSVSHDGTYALFDTGGTTTALAVGGTKVFGAISGFTESPGCISVGTAVGAAVDTWHCRESAAIIQFGSDAGTATAYELKGGDSTTSGVAGAAFTLSAGDGTVGNANGGNLNLAGGAKAGSGTVGEVLTTFPDSATGGAGARLTTTNVGGFLAPAGNPYIAADGDTWNNPGANAMNVHQFTLEYTLKVTKVVFSVTTAQAASNCGAAIYDALGTTRLITTGAVVTTSTGAKSTTLGTPVTLYPSVYWLGFTCDNGSVVVAGESIASVFTTLVNADFVITGTSSTSSAAGVPPTTIGTVSGGANNAAIVWLHP